MAKQRKKSFNDIQEQADRIIAELRSRQSAIPNVITNSQQTSDYADAEATIRKVQSIAAKYGNRIANTKSYKDATDRAGDAFIGRSYKDGKAEYDRIMAERGNRKYSQSTYMGTNVK